MNIITGADQKVLRTKAEPIKIFDENLKKLVKEMKETMLNPSKDGITGIGIAAPQVGVLKRVMLVTFGLNTKNDQVKVMVNPEIIEQSKQQVIMEEGCLSLPGEYGKVKRAAKIKVRWQNTDGAWAEKKLDGWDARIFLHEYDHLEGILFTDYLA